MRSHRIKLIMLVVVAVIIAMFGGFVSAEDGEILVVSETVTAEFPQGISFGISIKSPTPINDVRVHYNSVATDITTYAVLEFEPGTEVDAHFLLDAGGQSGGLASFVPVGSTIEYHFEVSNEVGEKKVTAPKKFLYLDSRFEWDHVSEGPVTVYHYGPTEKRANDILQASLQAVDRMSLVLGLEEVSPINVVAYNNYRHMVVALPPRPQAISEDLVTEGQAFSGLGVVMMLAFNEDAEGVASHEITHVILHDAAAEVYEHIPMWLNEGLAEFGNVAPSEDYDRSLNWGIYTRRLKPLWYLTTFSGDPNDVIISYGHARSVVAYLINTYGREKMAQLIQEMKVTLSLDAAMQRIYGFDQVGLDSEWRDHIGLRPLTDYVASSPDHPEPTSSAEELLHPHVTVQASEQSDKIARPTGSGPGCNLGSGARGASATMDPFLLLLLCGPIGFIPIARLKNRRIK